MANELQILEPWNYEKSVERTKDLVSAFRKVSLELVRELFLAKQALEPQGRSAVGTFVPAVQSWESYCNDIGLVKRTADRWLALYIPEEDRLLTVEEAKDLLEQRYRKLRQLVVEHIGDSSWRPEGWIKLFEARYQKELRAAELNRIAMADSFDQYIDEGGQIWLFDQPYLETLAERIGSYNADPRTYMRLCKAYEKDTTKVVPIQKQVSIFQLAKAALEDISDAARPEVTRFVAELLMRDAAGTLTY